MKQERKYTNWCLQHLQSVVVIVVHCKNQIQIQASKQENTQLCFVIFA